MEKKKKDWGYIFFSIRVYTALILLFFVGKCGPGLIRHYKQKKEMEQIHYGGSTKEANKSIELHNKKVIELQKAVNKVLKNNPSIYVFTNDTTPLDSVKLYPNINFDVFRPATFLGNPVIPRNKRVIKEITNFLKNEDSTGWYYIQLKKNNHKLNLKRFLSFNDSIEFKLITYFKPTEAYNERPIMKDRHKYSFLYEKRKDSFETRTFFFREHQLKHLKKKYKYRPAILRPYFKQFYNESFLFYFVCFNKNIDRDDFQTYTDLLLQGSLSELDCDNCKIIELNTTTEEGLKL